MEVIDLKKDAQAFPVGDLDYYDEYYYLPNSGTAVKVFRQEFNEDPHMNLEKIPLIRLVGYDQRAHQDDLSEIFDRGNVPIITRALHLPSGFRYIQNKQGKPSNLMKVSINIQKTSTDISDHIRPMMENDIDEIREMLRREYSLRYRFAEQLWKDYPNGCFVYDVKGEIEGATFNKIQGNELYMRQIFVPEVHQHKGIGESLYKARLEFARKRGLKKAHATVRNETERFHRKFGARKERRPMEYYVIKK
ncbi:MAG TPA: GNAT family N-acetyltransferase [Candidatus Nanoarchaeia archaeon]|nr:GNAT family N-acetyltransferase [Candidatus Nanoarchaeia archaeon]